MRRAAVGFAAALTVAFAGPAFAESDFDEIQDQEQPGSEIGVEIGKGKVEVERENGSPIFPLAPYAGAEPLTQSIFPVAPLLRGAPSSQLKPLDDAPVAGDPIDRELPGEGPEDLSGPDDDNPPPE